MSFAESLKKISQEKQQQLGEKKKLAAKWTAHESELLDRAVEMFKQRCTREAEAIKTTATVSFEVLSREIDGFPRRVLSGSSYLVDIWGEGLSAESWFYAMQGPAASFSSGAPVLFATVLQGMLPKFVKRVDDLGFQTCRHEEGTWKVHVAWKMPSEADIQAAIRARNSGARWSPEPERKRSRAEAPSKMEEKAPKKAEPEAKRGKNGREGVSLASTTSVAVEEVPSPTEVPSAAGEKEPQVPTEAPSSPTNVPTSPAPDA